MLPIKYLVGFYNSKRSLLNAFFYFIEFTDAMGHLWFLIALFWIFIIFSILKMYVDKVGGGAIHILLLSGILTFWISAVCPFNPFSFVRGMSYVFWFSIGCAFQRYRANHKEILDNKLLVLTVFILTAILSFVNSNGIFTVTVGLYTEVLLGMLLIYSLSACLSWIPRIDENKFFLYLVKASFIVYLLHDPINFLCLHYLGPYIDTNKGAFIFYFMRSFGNIGICLMLAPVIWKLKEVIIRWFNALKPEKDRIL